MDKWTLQIVGILVLVAGCLLGSLGVHRIAKNLSVSERDTIEAVRESLSADRESPGRPGRDPLREDVELHVWKSALERDNTVRKEKRHEGAVYLVAGALCIVWGLTALLNSRDTPKGG